MTTRRGFLAGLAGIIVAGHAPAIVKQPMKIWVPKKEDFRGRGFTSSIFYIDEAAGWHPMSAQESNALSSKSLDRLVEQAMTEIRETCAAAYRESGFLQAGRAVDRVVVRDLAASHWLVNA